MLKYLVINEHFHNSFVSLPKKASLTSLCLLKSFTSINSLTMCIECLISSLISSLSNGKCYSLHFFRSFTLFARRKLACFADDKFTHAYHFSSPGFLWEFLPKNATTTKTFSQFTPLSFLHSVVCSPSKCCGCHSVRCPTSTRPQNDCLPFLVNLSYTHLFVTGIFLTTSYIDFFFILVCRSVLGILAF